MAHQVIFRKKTSSVIPVTGDIPLNSLTIVDTSGTSPSNVIDRFFLMLNKGDCPAGWTLIVKYGTTEVLTQYDEVNTWSDGSVRTAVVRCFIPSINANATLQRNIWRRNISYSNTQGYRSLSDISAHDFKITFTDVKDETGAVVTASETLAANTNLNNALYTKKIAQGPNCDAWETWIKSANGHMQVKWNFEVWTDPTNTANVYAIMHAPWVRAGWRNVASPHGYTFKMEYFDGASSLRNYAVAHSVVAGDISTGNDTIANSTIETGRCLFLTSGTIGGVSAGTPYFAKRDVTGTIKLYTNAQAAYDINVGFQVDITSAANCTFTEYEALTYHTGIFARMGNSSEQWKEWYTAQEPKLEVAWTSSERAYLRKGGFLWPWRAAANPTPPANCDYYPGSLCWPSGASDGEIITGWDGVGDATGVLYTYPKDICGAFQNMNLTALRVAKVFGYCGTHLGLLWYDETPSGGVEVNTPLTFDNGSDNNGTAYAGMGTPRGTSDTFAGWSGIGTNNRFQGPAQFSLDHTHFQYSAFPAYMLTADPQLREILYQTANMGIFGLAYFSSAGPDRSKKYNGTQYYGIWGHWIQPRAEGYHARSFAEAVICAPDGSGIKSYIDNCISRTLAYHVDYRATEDSTYSAHGHWAPHDNSWQSPSPGHFSACNTITMHTFMANWLAMGYMRLDRLYRSANSSTVAQHFALFCKKLFTEFQLGDGFWSNLYNCMNRDSESATTWRVPSLWGIAASDPDAGTVSWDASNTVHETTDATTWGYLGLANGDFVTFCKYDPNGTGVAVPPTAISLGVKYKVINFNSTAHTYQLNPSPYDGTTVQAFTSQATKTAGGYIVAHDSATGYAWSGNSNYGQMITAALTMAAAYGFAGYSIPAANAAQRLTDMGTDWPLSNDPRFDFDSTVL